MRWSPPKSDRQTRMEEQIADLMRRVCRLEGLLTPEQLRQDRLIKQAEQVIDIARSEGQL